MENKNSSVALSTNLFQDLLCLPGKPLQIDLDHRTSVVTVTMDSADSEKVSEWTKNFHKLYEQKIREELAKKDEYKVSIREAVLDCTLSHDKKYIVIGNSVSAAKRLVLDLINDYSLDDFITANRVGEISLFNGSQIIFFSASDSPDKLKGHNLDGYCVHGNIILNRELKDELALMCVCRHMIKHRVNSH